MFARNTYRLKEAVSQRFETCQADRGKSARLSAQGRSRRLRMMKGVTGEGLDAAYARYDAMFARHAGLFTALNPAREGGWPPAASP